MRKTRILSLAVLALAAGAAFAVSTATAAKQAPFKVAWIYVGPHNDGGWSQAHDRGRLAVQKAFGSKVKTTYKELVPEGPQTCQVIESLIRDGNKMIFATSFGFQNCMLQEAKKHPDVLFEQATGTLMAKNMAEYFGAGEDSIYLAGMAAGAATKKNLIGEVVAFPIPEVLRHASAFALGAQAVNPKAKGQFAQSKGIPWVGYNSDARKFEPTSWLTAAIYNWGVYYVPRVKAAMDGTWKTGFYYGNIKDGFTDLAPFGPKVSAKTKALIAAKRKQLIDGSFHVFQGSLYDNAGKLRVPKGKVLS